MTKTSTRETAEAADSDPDDTGPSESGARGQSADSDGAETDARGQQQPDVSCPRARDVLAAEEIDELEADLVELARLLTAGTIQFLVLVGELDERCAWAQAGALSCEAWLADLCDIELATARRQVRVAQAMRRYPVLEAAMVDGGVSYSKARVMVGQLSDDNVDDLVEIARVTPAGRLGKAIAAWCQRNDDPEDIRRRQEQLRSLGWGTAADGMVDFHARLTPEAAASVCATIESTVRHLPHVPAGTPLRQQRADALLAVCTGEGDAGTPKTEIVVHVNADGSTFSDGTPVSEHAVAKMLPEAFISLLLSDAEQRPIDATPRRRFPTKRQRRVIEERQHECQQPGCHAEQFLQLDHVKAYHAGGPTVLDNLQLLCGHHNRAKGSS